MKSHLERLLRDALDRAVAAGELRLGRPPVFAIEVPSDPAFGDLASNVAMVLAREAGRPPRALAEIILRHVQDAQGWLAGTDIAGPGFINFRRSASFWRMILGEALSAGAAYGRSDVGRGAESPDRVRERQPDRTAARRARRAARSSATSWRGSSRPPATRSSASTTSTISAGRWVCSGASAWARYRQLCGRGRGAPRATAIRAST